ncbi:MAG: class I SAM-dependent methyltransferase [Hormoscilla sp. GUM202]|nr:class I SAM-dependent methyltransferase [Hormoscilla sp. GUM202]
MTKVQVPEEEKKREWLSWICDSQTPEELRDKYDTWANSYDRDVEKDWRFMPRNAALALQKVLPTKDAKILDAGAGTGLLGEALAELGYTKVIAADLSQEMLAVAKKKQVYKELYQCNLEDSQAFAKETFDAILATGVFALAHAGVAVLHNLFGYLKPDGVLLMTIRGDYRNQMQEALDKLPWSLVSQDEFGIYETDTMYVLVFRKGR